MNELLDFPSDPNEPNLNNFINTTRDRILNRDKVEIRIKIHASENAREKSPVIIERLPLKSIRATKIQKTETAEERIRLSIKHTKKDSEILAIKFFYKKFYPAEFDVYEKLNSWSAATITEVYIRRWVKTYFQDVEIQKKKQIEETEHWQTVEAEKNEKLKEFMERPIVKIQITAYEKEQIIFRKGENFFILRLFIHFMPIFYQYNKNFQ